MGRSGSIRRFFKTPKGLLIVILTLFAAWAARVEGLSQVAPGLLSAVIVAGVMDAIILRLRRPRWEFPGGAVLSALIVAMVLSAQQPWYVATVTSAVAILSKYVFRSRAGNVFNPAALAIVATFHLFDTGQSWWGALSEVTPFAPLVLVLAGAFIADRVDRMPLVLTFLGAYYLLFSAAAFLGDPGRVSEVFRPPDLEAVLFFALFILTDPPTAPVKYLDQIVCAVIGAVTAFAVFEWSGSVYYLLAGVLAGNVWEAWRRASRRIGFTFPTGIGAFLREITPWREERQTPARDAPAGATRERRSPFDSKS